MSNGIMFNEDNTHFWYTRNWWNIKIDKAEIERFIDQYANTNVTDFLFNCNAMLASFESEILETFMDKYTQKIENGEAVDYSENCLIKTIFNMYKQGLDFYKICIDRLREHSINPWMSVRMNDCHQNDLNTSFLHSNFFHENPQLRRVTHRQPIGYFDRCYDYAQDEIYNMMLKFVKEVINRYDLYGLELDWQREIFCFKIGHEYEGIKLTTNLTRDIRRILDDAEKKWGHKIKLAARTLTTPQMALECGFDVISWVREGLIDIIIPTPRWETTNNDIPVELWKRILQDYPVELAVGLEVLIKATPDSELLFNSAESVNALAAQYLSMGADKIYLFNYFDQAPPETKFNDPISNRKHINSAIANENYQMMLTTIGDKNKVVNSKRSHIVTYPEIGPEWFIHKKSSFAPLPLTSIGPNDMHFTRVRVGEIPKDAKIELKIGAISKDSKLHHEDIEIYVNSAPVSFLRNEKIVPEYTKLEGYVFSIENNSHMPPFLVVEIAARKLPITVDYIEVFIS